MARVYSRILVTGASGFVGRTLLARLSSSFPDATILGTGLRNGGPGNVELDIRDAHAVDQAVARFSPDGVVHLAAISQVQQAQHAPRATFEVNLGGTMNLAEAMRRHVPEARLIFVSSGEVYGASFREAGGPVDEATPLAPLNSYAASKAAADLLIGQMAHQGLRCTRLRPFNHTGPGQDTRFVLASFIAQIVSIERGDQQPVLSVGNLDAERDFLDVRDVVAAYRQALISDLPTGTILNIASGRARRIGDILDELLRRAKVAIRVVVDPARLRAVEIPVAVGQAARARAALGWAPTVPFERTLDDMLAAERTKPAS